mmetsp:Transcript_32173/g.76394  ORF Transcript_32173/g.76394 Transcript_32173/m.76394 type:complete len:261 (+) Transcript_32173:403-1185(+)
MHRVRILIAVEVSPGLEGLGGFPRLGAGRLHGRVRPRFQAREFVDECHLIPEELVLALVGNIGLPRMRHVMHRVRIHMAVEVSPGLEGLGGLDWLRVLAPAPGVGCLARGRFRAREVVVEFLLVFEKLPLARIYFRLGLGVVVGGNRVLLLLRALHGRFEEAHLGILDRRVARRDLNMLGRDKLFHAFQEVLRQRGLVKRVLGLGVGRIKLLPQDRGQVLARLGPHLREVTLHPPARPLLLPVRLGVRVFDFRVGALVQF